MEKFIDEYCKYCAKYAADFDAYHYYSSLILSQERPFLNTIILFKLYVSRHINKDDIPVLYYLYENDNYTYNRDYVRAIAKFRKNNGTMKCNKCFSTYMFCDEIMEKIETFDLSLFPTLRSTDKANHLDCFKLLRIGYLNTFL